MNAFKLVLAVLTAGAVLGCAGRSDPGQSEPAVRLARVIDLGVVNQDARLLGRDGGYTFRRNGRLVWVFGDTALRQSRGDGRAWLSGSWSASEDFDAADGLDLLALATDSRNQPADLLPFTEVEATFNQAHRDQAGCASPCGARYALWPGASLADALRQRSLLFYQKVYAEPGEFNFAAVGYGVAVWQDESARPERPVINTNADYPTLLFTDPIYQPGVGAWIENEWLFSFVCYRDDLDTLCRLARVRLEEVLDRDAWQFAIDEQRWTSDLDASTDLFFGASIMSATFNAFLDRYLVVYAEPLGGPIVMRTARLPSGPWSRPVKITQPLPSDNGNGWVYDGIMHPELASNSGQTLTLTYTRQAGPAREMRLLRVELAQP